EKLASEASRVARDRNDAATHRARDVDLSSCSHAAIENNQRMRCPHEASSGLAQHRQKILVVRECRIEAVRVWKIANPRASVLSPRYARFSERFERRSTNPFGLTIK